MSISDWIALGALAVAGLNPALAGIRSGARRDGKIDAALEQLARITADHEDRLRQGGL